MKGNSAESRIPGTPLSLSAGHVCSLKWSLFDVLTLLQVMPILLRQGNLYHQQQK